ncbi:MAG TPA: CCA tRNA nucleotidyltransferase [Acidobacteriaceae bacterium]|nr:CCA tRNA nucleotidyltransferase [Acidobacteriaceae bacterium]
MLSASPQFAAARHILHKLHECGYDAYLAGGCVRDLLLGREPKDYDVATSATPDIVLDLFPRTFAVGAHFGVVLVSMTIEGQATLTEVATFRSDGAYSDGRHPDAVRYTLSAEEDVQRRDFTINGLLLNPGTPGIDVRGPQRRVLVVGAEGAPGLDFETGDPKTNEVGAPCLDSETWDSTSLRDAVIDYVGGLVDLDAGILRAIGDPIRRFEEDHLRMLRAIRFASRFEFEIDPATQAAMRILAPKIEAVSQERVRDELTRMLTEGHARRAFELLDVTGLLAQVLPEVTKLKGVQQPPQYHPEGDVWIHTFMLLSQLEPGCSMTLAWGALLHDIGKPATFQAPASPGDRIRFNGHVEVGVRIAAEICRRLRFSNDETAQILALVENHMRFADTPRMKAATLKRFFRLDRFPEHLALHRMDCLASSGNLDHYNFARQQYEAIPPEEVRPTPLLTGRELIAAGYPPGPAFKTILHTVEEAQLEGSIHTPEEALALVRKLNFPP